MLDDLYRPAVAKNTIPLGVAHPFPVIPFGDGLQPSALGRRESADAEDSHLLPEKVDDARPFVLHKVGVSFRHEAVRFGGHFYSSSSFGVRVFRVEALAWVDFHESGLRRFLDAENGYNFVFHDKVLLLFVFLSLGLFGLRPLLATTIEFFINQNVYKSVGVCSVSILGSKGRRFPV